MDRRWEVEALRSGDRLLRWISGRLSELETKAKTTGGSLLRALIALSRWDNWLLPERHIDRGWMLRGTNVVDRTVENDLLIFDDCKVNKNLRDDFKVECVCMCMVDGKLEL